MKGKSCFFPVQCPESTLRFVVKPLSPPFTRKSLSPSFWLLSVSSWLSCGHAVLARAAAKCHCASVSLRGMSCLWSAKCDVPLISWWSLVSFHHITLVSPLELVILRHIQSLFLIKFSLPLSISWLFSLTWLLLWWFQVVFSLSRTPPVFLADTLPPGRVFSPHVFPRLYH
jgi:hypothetical protein